MNAAPAETRPATRVAIALAGLLAAFLLWHLVASAFLVFYARVPRGAVPLREWWVYFGAYPLDARPGSTAAALDAENARVVAGLRLGALVATLALSSALVTLARLLWPGANADEISDEAGWATWRHARRAGFSPHVGLYLGLLHGRYLRLGRVERSRRVPFAWTRGNPRKHLAIQAPSQSGKDVSFVAPLTLNDPGDKLSFIVLDPKLQAFERSAGWQRSIGADIHVFDPLSETGETACYDPCAYVRRNPDGSPTVDTWNDCEAISFALLDLPAKSAGNQEFWINTSRTAATGMLGFLSETPGADFTINGFVDLLFDPDAHERILVALDKRRKTKKPYTANVAQALREFLKEKGGDQVRDGIRKTIFAKIGVFFNPRVRAATRRNDFDLRAFKNKRASLYIGVAFGDMERLAPLIRVLFAQYIALNTRGRPGRIPFETVCIYNEFTAFGPLPDVVRGVGFVAEYGIRNIFVFQSDSQLIGTYGADAARSLLRGCKIKVVLGGDDDMDFCRDVSRRLGTVPLKRRSVSTGGGLMDLLRGRVNESDDKRALLTEYQVSQLPDDQALVMHQGARPVLIRRVPFYQYGRFSTRVKAPPALPAIEVDLVFDAPPVWEDDGMDIADLPIPDKGPDPAATFTPPQPDDSPGLLVRPPAEKKRRKGTAKPKAVPKTAPPPSAPPAASGEAKASPMPLDPTPEAGVARAEAIVLSAVGKALDLGRFRPSPDEARRLVDEIVCDIPGGVVVTRPEGGVTHAGTQA